MVHWISLGRKLRLAVGVLACLGILGCAGGGETVISGLGNSSNVIGSASLFELIAKELAIQESTPVVTDQELNQVYAAIRTRALDGEPEAALVLLRVAAYQRSDD